MRSGHLAAPLPTCGHGLSRFCSSIPAGDAYNVPASKPQSSSFPGCGLRAVPLGQPSGRQRVRRPGAVLWTAGLQVLLQTPVPSRGSAPDATQRGQLDSCPRWLCGLRGVARPRQDQPKGTSCTGTCVASVAGSQLCLRPRQLFALPWLHPVSVEPLVPGPHPGTLAQEQASGQHR